MKPFVLLATRPEDAAADAEHAAFLRFSGLRADELLRVRLEAAPLPDLDLDALSGIFLGGSPFNASEPVKSDLQRRVEADLDGLLAEVVGRDLPFFGACYGVGALGTRAGGVVDDTYREPVGAARVELTAQGRGDPLLAGLPDAFGAYVGHKEALSRAPADAVVLATSATCPVQMFRIGRNVYATQFHPELDEAGLVARMRVYAHHGYFPPKTLTELEAQVAGADVGHAHRLLRAFVERYARD